MITSSGKYYLYRHIRLDKNEPFYIGVGTKPNSYNSFNQEYKRAISKIGRNVIWKGITNRVIYDVEILLESDNYKFILQKEIEFIKTYGRIDLKTGTLANLTNGGELNNNRVISIEHRLKISEANKGKN